MVVEHHAYVLPARSSASSSCPAATDRTPSPSCSTAGFWRAQHGRRQTRPLCTDLAARGWAAWNVEYRRLGRLSGGGWPRTLEDVAAAVDHLADIPRVPLDLRRVVAIGHSAGGHLATWLATRPAPQCPRDRRGRTGRRGRPATRLGAPALARRRPPAPGRDARDGARALRGGLAGRAPPARRARPARPRGGGRDGAGRHERALRRGRRDAAGDRVELALVPGEGHLGHLDPAGRLWAAVPAWLP